MKKTTLLGGNFSPLVFFGSFRRITSSPFPALLLSPATTLQHAAFQLSQNARRSSTSFLVASLTASFVPPASITLRPPRSPLLEGNPTYIVLLAPLNHVVAPPAHALFATPLPPLLFAQPPPQPLTPPPSLQLLLPVLLPLLFPPFAVMTILILAKIRTNVMTMPSMLLMNFFYGKLLRVPSGGVSSLLTLQPAVDDNSI